MTDPRPKKKADQLDRQAPMTAAGTRMSGVDKWNEWMAYLLVVLITGMIGIIAENLYRRYTGNFIEKPEALVAALAAEESGGRLDENPLTGMARVPDDPAREKQLLAAIAQDPSNAESHRSLGDYYYDTLQPEEAIAQYEAYLELQPDDVPVMTDLATMFFVEGLQGAAHGGGPMMGGDPNRGPLAAVGMLNEAVTVDPTFAPAWQNLGWAYMQINEHAKALEAYRNALTHLEPGPNREAIEGLIAQLEGGAQSPPGAPGSEAQINPLTGEPIPPLDEEIIAQLQQHILDNPSDPSFHLQLANYYYDAFKVDEALAHYEAYLAAGGEPTPGMRTDQATVLSQRDVVAALKSLDAIVAEHPDFFPAWINLAMLHAQASHQAEALAALKQAAAAAPDIQTKASLEEQVRAWESHEPVTGAE